jgi:hypothetical protein
MRILIAVLVIGLAAAAWWGLHEPAPPAATVTAAPAPATAANSAPASTSAASAAITFAPRAVDTTPAAGAASPTSGAAVAPPSFTIVGAVLFPGRQPALTLRVAGELRTVVQGDVIDGFRVESIDRDRVVLVHVESGSRFERLYADAGSMNAAPVATSASGGPLAQAQAPAASNTPAAAAAPATPTPPVNYNPPRAPAGATVNDNPLVGAIIPTSPGQAPPGMSGPKPVPLRPGQAPPAGPVAIPVPPNAQGPVPR